MATREVGKGIKLGHSLPTLPATEQDEGIPALLPTIGLLQVPGFIFLSWWSPSPQELSFLMGMF